MSKHLESEIGKGARVNAVGLIGKIAGPLFMILVARLFGDDIFGIYITALALVEMALALLIAGFKDGALIFVARHSEDEKNIPRLYDAFSNALALSLILAGILILLANTLGPRALESLYPQYGVELATTVRWMAFALPFLAFERIVLSATQGLKIMKYEAFVNGFLRPVLLLVAAALVSVWSRDIVAIALAYLGTQLLIGFYSAFVFNREMSWTKLGKSFASFKLDRELLAFAIPQNFNAVFTRFVTNIDILMLGIFGLNAATVGLYGAGAMIVRELRHIKLVFSTSFAPHIAKLVANNELPSLARLFSTTTRWTMMLMVPAVLVVALLRNDLLSIIDTDFATTSALFMIVLLPIPYLQGSLGFAGNVIVMAGRSKLNLYNSVGASALNIVLNLYLIPRYGLVGAALASSISAAAKMGTEFYQMRSLLNVRPLFSHHFQPHLAGAISIVLFAVSMVLFDYTLETLLYRILTVSGVLIVYLSSLAILNRKWTLASLPEAPESD